MERDKFEQLAAIIPDVSHETFANLCCFETMLRKWQPHINLIANSTLESIWQRHILDSAQLFPLCPAAQLWVDLGSGGGFPALVLACLLKQKNKETGQAADIYLIESNGKKAAFLRQVIQNLALPAAVWQNRIEDIAEKLPAPNIITARAVASLNHLCAFIAPLMQWAERGECLALLQKGRLAEQEIAEARQNWHFDCERRPSSLKRDSVILLIRNIAAIR